MAESREVWVRTAEGAVPVVVDLARVHCMSSGWPLAAYAPADRALAQSLAARAVKGEVDLDQILELCGPYTFLGFVSRELLGPGGNPQLVDGRGCLVAAEVLPGDSFFSLESVAPAGDA